MSYLIDNYRPKGTELSSAEFIKKTAGALSITKTHGLGAGVYGLVHGTKTERAGVEILSTHEITNPVLLDANHKTAMFIEFTQYFNDLIEKYIYGTLKGSGVTTSIDSNEEFLVSVFATLFPQLGGDAKSNILRSLKAFSGAYRVAAVGDFLWQPINYLLMPTYKGIYNSSEEGNTLDRGSVLFYANEPRHQKQAFNREGAFVPAGKKLVAMGGLYSGLRRSRSNRSSALRTKRANRKYITK